HGIVNILHQHRKSNVSVLLQSSLFTVQILQSYKAIENTMAWVRHTVVLKVTSLLFNPHLSVCCALVACVLL
ncbi:hypothetical protein NG726_39220, partial [Pseudomonas sp. MOB-449]|nr:hypothetical protein [Pseudomonas sp. MOB-449]